MSHQGGLAALDEKVSIWDREAVVAALEKQEPKWTVGEHGYHPRTTPSSEKGTETAIQGGAGKTVGLEVHQLFESISWLKEGEKPSTPQNLAGMIVDHALAEPEVRAIFEEREGVTLYREQAFEVMASGKWMSGVIDRMHVCTDGVTIYDFKTDMAEVEEQLTEKYQGQMKAYREAMSEIMKVPLDSVRSFLVSTHLKKLIEG